jgi:hypothetical protein
MMPNRRRFGVQQLCRHVPILALKQERPERQALACRAQASLPQQSCCAASIRILMVSRCRIRHAFKKTVPNSRRFPAPVTTIA